MIQAITAIIPRGVIIKNYNMPKSLSVNSWLTIRLGGEAINVNNPDILAIKDKGIKYFVGFFPMLSATLTTIGNMRATVPVLLRKAPIHATMTNNKTYNRFSLLPENRTIIFAPICAKPVRKIPAPTINNPAIIMTTWLEKPANASVVVKTPVNTSTNNAVIATRSGRIRLFINSVTAHPKTTNVIVSCMAFSPLLSFNLSFIILPIVNKCTNIRGEIYTYFQQYV